MAATIDFSKFTDQALQDALMRIDKNKHPDNYAACLAEIEKRKQKKTQQQPEPAKTQNTGPIQITYRFSFEGNGLDLALVYLKNFFLLIITFGLYFSWARTNIRRYLWSNTHLQGDRFTYTGTGKELFIGMMKLFAILFVAGMILNITTLFIPKTLQPIPQFLIIFVYMYLFALASYSGLKYRALRTLWRQIRFNVDRDKESTREFLWLYFKGAVLSGLTLGLYTPVFTMNKMKFLIEKANYGGKHFKFSGQGKEYFGICLENLFLTIITLGIYLPWFIADTIKYKVEHTSFGQARFKFKLSGKDLFIYSIVGYFGTLFTLGLASPWVIVAFRKLFSEAITLEGYLDLAGIQKIAQNESALGDEIAMDYDIDLGI